MAINIYGDPLLGNNSAINQQTIEAQRQYLAQLEALSKNPNAVSPQSHNPIWDKIDDELSTLTHIQKKNLMDTPEYQEASLEVNTILQEVFLSMMKPQVENTEVGKKALQAQYEVVKRLKKTVIEQTNNEMDEHKKLKEYFAKNPNATYNDFINSK